MDKVIKIIAGLLIALAGFLLGWLAHAWKNRNKVAKEVKKAISDLNKEHKKALDSLRMEYDEKLKRKDQIIKSLKEIINRLIKLLKSKEENGKSLVDYDYSAKQLYNTLVNNLAELNRIK